MQISKLKLDILKNVKETLLKNIQDKSYKKEACGILIGTHSICNNQVCITSITEPTKKDKRGKYFFKMDSRHHQKILNEAFEKSGNEAVYVGTWHTHPENYPDPSSDDIKDWRKQFKSNKKLFNKMLFCIVGIKEVKFWVITARGISLIDRRNISYE